MNTFDLTIAGEVNFDLVLYGLDKDIQLDREVLAIGFEMTLGSSSAILAHNLSVLGKRVGFITRFGVDEMGQIATKGRLSSRDRSTLRLYLCPSSWWTQ